MIICQPNFGLVFRFLTMEREIWKGGFWERCECFSTIANLGLAFYETLVASKHHKS